MTNYYFLRNGQYLQRVSLKGSPPSVTEVRNIGPIPVNCKINVTYDFNRDGIPSVFCHDQTTGELFLYFYYMGDYVKSSPFGIISPSYELQVCRFFRGTGEEIGADIFGHNRDRRSPDYNKVTVWHTTGTPPLGPPVELNDFWGGGEGSLDLWRIPDVFDLQLGDFNGDGILDIFGRARDHDLSITPGDIRIWPCNYLGGSLHAEGLGTYFGSIGLEWKLQVVDINGDGCADVFGCTAANDLRIWYNTGRSLDGGHYFGGLGPDPQHLQVTYLNDDGDLDVLGQLKRTGDIQGWYSNSSTVVSNSKVGFAPDWMPLACWPQTRVV